jgi:succinate dehydrogenase/fumarate reductase cytochrome b subunit
MFFISIFSILHVASGLAFFLDFYFFFFLDISLNLCMNSWKKGDKSTFTA